MTVDAQQSRAAGARTRSVVRVTLDAGAAARDDVLAVEEPLEIRVNGRGYAVTMRTPGDDEDLAAGFLVSEGVVRSAADLGSINVLEGPGHVIDVEVGGPGALVAMDRQRHVYTTSSCGVCGLASIDAVATTSQHDVTTDGVRVSADVLAALPEGLREQQSLFESTGGVHAAGLFDALGTAVVVREDVGRHNAVDKVVGRAMRDGTLPLRGHVLQVSGRASFELVQKAAMAGIPVLAAVSAPSSLAVELAESVGVTVVGFSRGASFNVYSRPDRVLS